MGLDGSDRSSTSPCSSPRSPRLQQHLHNLMHAAAAAKTASSSPPPSPSRDPQRLILQHYAARSIIPSNSSTHPNYSNPSPIANVKLLHAWITWRQIQIFSRPGDSVLDLACGKGGDLPKWSLALAGSYLGVDAVAPLLDEARRRHSSLPSTSSFPASFLCADCFSPALLSSEPCLSSRLASFDICSCQFALHYAWCSEERARAAIRHVSALLKPGGYFIGTIPDAVAILAKLRQALRSPPPAASFAGSPPSPPSAAGLHINKMRELFSAKLAIETVADVDGVESGTESIGDDDVDCFCYVIGSNDSIDGFLDYSHSKNVQEIIDKKQQQQQKIIGRIGVKLMDGMGPGAVDGVVGTGFLNVDDDGILAAAAREYAPELENIDGYSGSVDARKESRRCRCKLRVKKGRSLHGQEIDGGEDKMRSSSSSSSSSRMRSSSSSSRMRRSVDGEKNGVASFGNSHYKVTFSEENWKRALSLQLDDEDDDDSEEAPSPFGIRYEFYLADAVNHCPEWLVPLSSLVRLAEEEGLRLVSTANFHHFYQRHSSHYSHNHKALTAEDWDCAAIYLAFAFQKQEEPQHK